MTFLGDKYEGDFESGCIETLEDLRDLIKWEKNSRNFDAEKSKEAKLIEISFRSDRYGVDNIDGIPITVEEDIPEDFMRFKYSDGEISEFCV